MSGDTDRWQARAEENIEKWGNQAPATLFLAMVEEMGEIAEELTEQAPGPHPDNPSEAPFRGWEIIHEMADLGLETRDFLESNFEEPAGTGPMDPETRESIRHEQALGVGVVQDPEAVRDELDDLAPLCFQLRWKLNSRPESTEDHR